MRLLVDMNLSPKWAAWFQERSIEAVRWTEVGSRDALDTAIMTYARHDDFIGLTQDLDFGAMPAATQGGKPSVAQIRANSVAPEDIGGRLLLALQRPETQLHQGALLTLDLQCGRLAQLPLRPPLTPCSRT